MKRSTLLPALLFLGLVAMTRESSAQATQATFAVPFKFEAGGKSFPVGDYAISQDGKGAIILRLAPKTADVSIPVSKNLPQPNPSIAEPQLVFDMVGNFEPSYSEYVTDYVLAEVWLPGSDGFLVLATKRSQQHKTIKGQQSKK
jgi:hypothetical protein